MTAIKAFKPERTAHSNRLGDTGSTVPQRCLNTHLKSLDRKIARLESEVMARLKADAALWRRYRILTSIP